jgi:hypothetical protein
LPFKAYQSNLEAKTGFYGFSIDLAVVNGFNNRMATIVIYDEIFAEFAIAQKSKSMPILICKN